MKGIILHGEAGKNPHINPCIVLRTMHSAPDYERPALMQFAGEEKEVCICSNYFNVVNTNMKLMKLPQPTRGVLSSNVER